METSTRNPGTRVTVARWSDEELNKYYKYFHKYKRDCSKVAKAFNGSRSEAECEALYHQFQSFLSIPYSLQLEVAFIAMVNDSYKTHEIDSDTASDEDGPRRRNGAGSTLSAGGSQRGRRTPRGQSQYSKPPRPAGSLSNLGLEGASGRNKAATPVSKPSTRGSTPGTSRRSARQAEQEMEVDDGAPASGTRRKRSRRLFGADEQPPEDYKSYLDDWRAGLSKDAADDVGEGVDALLSLASIAHASSSAARQEQEEQEQQGGRGAGAEQEAEADAAAAEAAAEQGDEGQGGDQEGDEEPLGVGKRRGRPPTQAKGEGGTPSRGVTIHRLETPSRQRDYVLSSPSGRVSPGVRAHGRGRGRGRGRRPAASRSEDGDYHPLGGDGEEEGGRRRARAPSLHEDDGGSEQQEGGLKRSASAELPSPSSGLPPKRQASYAAMTGRYGATSYEALHNGAGSYEGLGPDPEETQQQPSSRTGMGTRAVAARAIQRIGSTAPNVNHNRRKSVPERIPGVFNSPFKLLFSRGAAAQANGSSSSLVPAGGIVPGMQQVQQAAPKQGPLGETGEPMGAAELALRHCLGPKARRWATYEFHCSALDRPFFLRSELQELLHHAGLGHVGRLTRSEWGVLRAMLGAPRRLSLAFLREERVRLEHYRELTRKKYEEVGAGMEVPPELPRPLKVGQAVVARHPCTRQLHDGIILTVKSNKYRVQFSRTELMTEVVRDTDVMPVDPTENLPAAMAHVPAVLNGRVNPPSACAARRKPGMASRSARIKQEPGMHHAGYHPPLGIARPSPQLQQAPPPEPDAQLLAEVGANLDVKEALLGKLKRMNLDAEGGQHLEPSGRPSEEFQRQYASVMMQLKEVNDKLQVALNKLHSRPHLGGVLLPAAPLLRPEARPGDGSARGGAVGLAQAVVAQAHEMVRKCVGSRRQASTAAGGALAADATAAPAAPAPAAPAAPAAAAAAGHAQADAAPAAPLEGQAAAAGPSSAAAVPDSAIAVTVIAAGTAAEVSVSAAAAAAAAPKAAVPAPAASSPSSCSSLEGLDPQLQLALEGSAFAEAAAAAGAAGGSQRVQQLVAGCVSLLLALQRAGAGGVAPAVLDQALEMLLPLVKPRATSSVAAYEKLAAKLGSLRELLCKAR